VYQLLGNSMHSKTMYVPYVVWCHFTLQDSPIVIRDTHKFVTIFPFVTIYYCNL
jgi:hypothetical protein